MKRAKIFIGLLFVLMLLVAPVSADWVYPNFAPNLEPPSNGPFVPMSNSDFGQGFNSPLMRAMKWDPAWLLYTHTNGGRDINYFDYGCVNSGAYGPYLQDPDGGLTAFPSIVFIAPVAGTFSIDGTGVVSGVNTRLYVQHVTDTGASVLGGYASAVGSIDFGADAAFQNVALNAGEGLQILIYNETTLDLGNEANGGVDPMKIVGVPEPATISLLSIGVLGLLRRRR